MTNDLTRKVATRIFNVTAIRRILRLEWPIENCHRSGERDGSRQKYDDCGDIFATSRKHLFFSISLIRGGQFFSPPRNKPPGARSLITFLSCQTENCGCFFSDLSPRAKKNDLRKETDAEKELCATSLMAFLMEMYIKRSLTYFLYGQKNALF